MSADMLDGLWVIAIVSVSSVVLAPVLQWLLLPNTDQVT